MKILKITAARGQYIVDLDTDQQLTVSEDVLVRFRLLKGMELTETELQTIKKASSFDTGLQLAYRWLSYQLRTEKELRTYLRDHEIEGSDIPKIIQRLKELQLVDDEMFAKSFVRTQMRTSERGPGQIQQQLIKKGVAPSVIESALAEYSGDNQLANASNAAAKLLKRQHNKSWRESLQKVRMGLMQKGFSKEIIDEAMATLQNEPDENQEQQALEKLGDRLWERNRKLPTAKRRMKVKQSLYQKGFSLDLIESFLQAKEVADDE